MGIALNHGIDFGNIHAVTIFHEARIKLGPANKHYLICPRQPRQFIAAPNHVVHIVKQLGLGRFVISIACEH